MFRPLTARADLPCGQARICVVRSVPCFRHQRDLTPEMPSCLLRGHQLVARSEEIPGKSCQRLWLAERFQLFQPAIKTSPLGKAQHFADNFQSVIGNRLIISDKARPGPHLRMPEIRGFWNACRVNFPWDPVSVNAPGQAIHLYAANDWLQFVAIRHAHVRKVNAGQVMQLRFYR
ncbi:Uncharacterised protein [Escherichia coli]|nr:Uncharacterised protein [Escherichia coli]